MTGRASRRLWLATIALLVQVAAVKTAAQPPPPSTRILLLYGILPDAPAIAAFTQRLRSTISDSLTAHVEFYEEFLDLDRFSAPSRQSQLGRYFADKYSGFRLDAIVAVGTPALTFAAARLNTLFPGVPVVAALVINETVDTASLPANVTGRLKRLSYDQTLMLARRLQPDVRRVVVVSGASAYDSAVTRAVLREIAPIRGNLDVDVLQGLPYETLLSRVRQLPARSIVFFTSLRRDGRGQSYTGAEAVGRVARSSSVPVYGHVRNWLGDGVVGGAVMSGPDEGTEVARITLRVLRTVRGRALPPLEVASSELVVDWRELKRWGLQEARLPAGTEVLFRAVSGWRRHRAPILIVLVIIAAQMLLIALLLLERRRRLQIQLALADQVAYEQTVAQLTTDAVRHASEDAPRALEDALARVGRYSGVRRAVLTQFEDAASRPAMCMLWPDSHLAPNGQPTDSDVAPHESAPLTIPLVADDTAVGQLELYPPDGVTTWPEPVVRRLVGAAELIAGAIARSRTARALRDGEALNRAVLASLSTQIAILDPEGTIVRVNEAWAEVAARLGDGGIGEAFLGANYLGECRRAEARGCDDARLVRLGIEGVLRGEVALFRHQFHCAPPDERWYELSVDPLEHGEGGAIVTHLDITDRRIAEMKAEEARRQVAHMGRVAVVADLTATLSHELRQPLAAIRANAEAGLLMLADIPSASPDVTAIFRDIIADDARAADVIDHLRVLLRNERPATTAVDLNDVCRRAAHLLNRDALIRQTRIELALESTLPPLPGDPVQLQQVVLNLALNALDAMAASADRSITIGTTSRDGKAELSVRDTGPGLNADVKSHLFESFYSTKSQGMGMGLVIVRSIVERHHGYVRAENDSSGGAVFRVLLPLA